MAKLAIVVTTLDGGGDLQATAVQCWTSINRITASTCTLMSMMSERLMPQHEVDITIASMYALQLAGGTLSALVDWNSNYADIGQVRANPLQQRARASSGPMISR
jgi:L-fucose isomerase-like protein